VNGLINSSNVLQKSALSVAVAHGIGVGRIIEDHLEMVASHIGEASVVETLGYERESYDNEAEDALLVAITPGHKLVSGFMTPFSLLTASRWCPLRQPW
jgi:hypothetical protein